MITICNILASLLIPLLLGYLTFSAVYRHPLPIAFKLAVSFGLGFGLLTFSMLCLDILHIPFSRASISLPLLFLSFFLFLIILSMDKKIKKEKNIFFKVETSAQNLNILTKMILTALVIYILFNIFFVFLRTWSIPVSTWDALATIAFKAKIFFYEQSIPDLNLLPHRSYPLLVSLAESWIAFNLGFWDDTLIQIIFPLAFLSYLCIHYYFLKFFTDGKWALGGVALLLSSNFFLYHATLSYRDFFLMYYACSTILLLLFWHHTRHTSFLFLASLFMAFASFTKLEGTAFILIFLTVFFILMSRMSSTSRLKHFSIFVIPTFIISGTFYAYKIYYHSIKDGEGIGDKTNFQFMFSKILLIPEVLVSYRDNLLFTGNWNLLWGALIFSLLLSVKIKKSFETNILLWSIFLFFGLYTCTAIFSSNFIWIAGEQNSAGLSRLILHFFPLCVLSIVLINFSLFNSRRD
ncbi:MAG: hypothetical protein KBD53_04495 [Candidatus Omnitrophica bacterium]|nr:hypothetical protein [Candidatus Omnitrophota bacterium]